MLTKYKNIIYLAKEKIGTTLVYKDLSDIALMNTTSTLQSIFRILYTANMVYTYKIDIDLVMKSIESWNIYNKKVFQILSQQSNRIDSDNISIFYKALSVTIWLNDVFNLLKNKLENCIGWFRSLEMWLVCTFKHKRYNLEQLK